MRRKKTGKEHGSQGEAATTMHRLAVLLLATANVFTFTGSLLCLRELGQAETSSDDSPPDIDLSGLYDDSIEKAAGDLSQLYDVDETKSVLEAVSSSEKSLRIIKDLFPGVPQQEMLENAVPLVATAPISQGFAGAAMQQPQQPPIGLGQQHPGVYVPLQVPKFISASEADRAKIRQAAKACPPCSSKVRGPLPTTLSGVWASPTAKGPVSSACKWTIHPRSFLSDLTFDLDNRYDLAAAQELCIEIGNECNGITCDMEKNRCSVRSGTEPRASPNPGETSYLKFCGPTYYATAGRASDTGEECKGEDDRTQVSSINDLRDGAIVILAHSRGDALKACLNALLIQPESKMFKLFVSLDLKDAVPEMTKVVNSAKNDFGVDIGIWEVEPFAGDPTKHNKDQIAWFKFNAGKIAHHYWAAFENAFMSNSLQNVIFMEEDLIAAPDFLALFRSTYGLLSTDPSLWCVGAWNDIGMSYSFSDQCRLLRTTYFPGLGFLLTKSAWDELRKMWPTAPTMGWDYWMRVAFRKLGKECIIPEVPRIHHMVGSGGSSINNAKQFKLFKSMGLAQIESTCELDAPCHQFGDVSYLLQDNYEQWVRGAIASSQTISVDIVRSGANLQRTSTYVVPYVFEEYASVVELAGLRPKGTKAAIPQDIRSEHYGLFDARHVQSRARLIFVDRRSPKQYLPEMYQVKRSAGSMTVAGDRGQSCLAACATKQMQCVMTDMHFINNCHALEEHFGCEAGCAHQVGKELPVYVPDETQPTYRQCLVTFISPLRCEAAHPSTSRLCACSPAGYIPPIQHVSALTR